MRATSRLADNSWPLLRAVVEALTDAGVATQLDPDIGHDADVFFGCGLLTRELIAAGEPLEVIAAPVFEGEQAAVYRSVLICRENDELELEATSHARMAINEYGSWSGWNAYLAELESHSIPPPRSDRRGTTGSHLESMTAVRAGDYDFAAIDTSVWHHHENETQGLRVFAVTRDWPAPPLSVRSTVGDRARALLSSLPRWKPATDGDYDEMFAAAARFR